MQYTVAYMRAARSDRYRHEDDDSEAESEGEASHEGDRPHAHKGSPHMPLAVLQGSERDSGCETPPAAVPADLMFRSFSSCSPRFTKEFRSIEVLFPALLCL